MPKKSSEDLSSASKKKRKESDLDDILNTYDESKTEKININSNEKGEKSID